MSSFPFPICLDTLLDALVIALFTSLLTSLVSLGASAWRRLASNPGHPLAPALHADLMISGFSLITVHCWRLVYYLRFRLSTHHSSHLSM